MTLSKRFLTLAFVLTLAAASGCTGSDVLSTGNSAFSISVEVTNAMSSFDLARFSISSINVLPNDPAAEAALGQNPIGVIASAEDELIVDLNQLAEFEPTTIRLSTGSYRIDRLEMREVLFRNRSAPRPAPDCTDLEFYLGPSEPFSISIDGLGNSNITVTEAGTGLLTIKIDAAALITAFIDSFASCNLAGSAATGFSLSAFDAAAPTFIVLQ